MDLLAHYADAQDAVQQVRVQKQLDQDDAIIEAVNNALVEALDPRVKLHQTITL